jgi:hypothetical protein
MLLSPVRRTALLSLAGLLAVVLPVIATTAPAQASAACSTEKPNVLGLTCDDELPPITSGATGTQSAAGQVTVTAAATYSDADADPTGYQCRLVGTAAWGPCTISDLSAGDHQVDIRAVDTADYARNTPCDDLLCGNAPEVPDYDATPERVTVTVTGTGGGGGTTPLPSGPNGEPETKISGGPRDKITPGAPVTLTRRTTVVLQSSEPATYNCAINAKKVACHDGTNVLRGLKPGTQVFVAQAVDKQGNFDATPASITLYVPINLNPDQGEGWKRVKSRGSYAGDYVSTTRKGAVLTLGALKGVHELRLVAPTGPNLGKVAVRIGHGTWRRINLKSAKAQKLQVFVIRGPGSRGASGSIQIKAVKVPAGGAVAVDAIVAR